MQQFITKLSEKEKKIFYVTVGVILLALFDRLFLGPVTSQLKALDEDIAYQENSIKRDLRFLSYKGSILHEQEAMRPYFSAMEQTEDEIIAGFLKKIEILASRANIKLIRVTPSPGEQKPGFMQYKATLDCEGEFQDVLRFMYMIDSAGELLRITKLDISPKKSGANTVTSLMTVMKAVVDADTSEGP